MRADLLAVVSMRAAQAALLYHRLVLLVAPPRLGKTTVLRALHAQHGWPLINLNLELSRRLLERSARQRPLHAARDTEQLVDETNAPVVLLDNLEMLFHPDLHMNPLQLLQKLSRHRTVIASWRGTIAGGTLCYAVPEHREHRRYPAPDAQWIDMSMHRGFEAAEPREERPA